MLKYVDTKVTFGEVPDEITLCINIANCPNHCKGCHSPYLAKDEGIILDTDRLLELCSNNEGITCVCLMGGDKDPVRIAAIARYIKRVTKLKTAWYSGKDGYIEHYILGSFDYIKRGPYIEALGSLNNPKTNQKMFEIHKKEDESYKLVDITSKFWKL